MRSLYAFVCLHRCQCRNCENSLKNDYSAYSEHDSPNRRRQYRSVAGKESVFLIHVRPMGDVELSAQHFRRLASGKTWLRAVSQRLEIHDRLSLPIMMLTMMNEALRTSFDDNFPIQVRYALHLFDVERLEQC